MIGLPGSGPSRMNPASLVAIVVVVFVVLTGLAVLGSVFIGLSSSPFGGFFSPLLFAPFCGILFFVILVIVLAIAGQGAAARRLPPPPPIQQPMVPAGIRGAAELACPNCGAAPTNVDRFGIATCAYCGTRYLVR